MGRTQDGRDAARRRSERDNERAAAVQQRFAAQTVDGRAVYALTAPTS